MHEKLLNRVLLPLLYAVSSPVLAVDLTWSGFGTVGYAISDQPYSYQRTINDKGTFERDSILGAQLDARFSQAWGATVQARLAPSDRYDERYQGSLAWAFVSWRPSDDWLIRVGKIRLPLMLNTENLDVGSTFDLARLPQEVYSITPTNDVMGISVSKSWLAEAWEFNLEGYTGQERAYWRYYGRVIRDSEATPGAFYLPIDIRSSGLVLTAKDIGNTFRIGIHEAEATRSGEKTHVTIPYTMVAPNVGYYDLSKGNRVDSLIIPVQTLGASISLPADVRVTAEYARMKVRSASEGLSRWGAYLSVSRRIGNWTPYAYVAKTRSTGSALRQYELINQSASNPLLPASINKYQTLAADIVAPYDQWTGAVGASYRLSPGGLLKMEWAQTHTGVASNFVDAPTGSTSGDRLINVYSLSYSFSF